MQLLGGTKTLCSGRTRASTVDFNVAGGGAAAAGVYYLPGATFNANGNQTLGSAPTIADQFAFGGTANFSITTGNYVFSSPAESA